MPLVLETHDFTVQAPDKPHHSRENGGHIVIWPKAKYEHLSDMPLAMATNFMHLNQVVGEAFMRVAAKNGLRVARVNYACFGNWDYKDPTKEHMTHTSLYLRTWDEKHPDNNPAFQAFPEALYLPDRNTGYYDNFKPLTDGECGQIRDEILHLFHSDKYLAIDSKI